MSGRARSPRSPVVGAGSLGASFAMHAFVAAAGAYIVSVSPDRDAAPTGLGADIAIDLGASTGPGSSPRPANPDEPEDDLPPPLEWKPGGREDPARPDTDRRGRGGSRRADSPALNLAEHDEGLTLSRDPTSRIDRDQVQRVRTSQARASDEDRRALSKPMELIFVATGSGRLKEHRAFADRDPDRGALLAPPFSSVGLGAPAVPETDASGDLPRRDPAGVKPSPGVGVLRGPVGADHRPAAAVATGRPWVPAGPEAFVAEEKGPAADRMNSEQEVAATIQSLVHASTAGGVPGSGQGGEEAPGYSGSGGPAGPGSRAAPFGAGAGPFTAVLDDDPRVSNYWRRVQGKIDAQWDERSFPRWASLEGRQGWAVISFVILADGRVGDLRIARPSGVPEFDENVRRAVQRAAPFEPPPAIAAASKRWSITFDARNPAVR